MRSLQDAKQHGAQQPTKAEIDRLCQSEKVAPNLVLREPTRLIGRVTDIQGVPLKKSQVELRRYVSKEKQVRLKAVTTDDNGNFDLGKRRVPPSRLTEPHILTTTKVGVSGNKLSTKYRITHECYGPTGIR